MVVFTAGQMTKSFGVGTRGFRKEGLDWHKMSCFFLSFCNLIGWRFIDDLHHLPTIRTRWWFSWHKVLKRITTFSRVFNFSMWNTNQQVSFSGCFWLPLLSYGWFETCFSQVDTISACTPTPTVAAETRCRAFFLAGEAVQQPWRILDWDWGVLNLQKKTGTEFQHDSPFQDEGPPDSGKTSPIVWDRLWRLGLKVSNENKANKRIPGCLHMSLLGRVLHITRTGDVKRWWQRTNFL